MSRSAGFTRSPLFPIFLIVLVDVFALTLMIPLLPFYAKEFGASPLVVGVLLASYPVAQFISGPILGRISDSAGRRPTLLVSQIGTLIGFLMLGFAGSLWMLFLGRIIDGLTAGNLTIAQAYISDVTKPEERTRAFGLIGIAFGLGFLVGPAVSGLLAQNGYQWPAFLAAFLSLTAFVTTWLLLPEVERKHPAERSGRLEQMQRFFRNGLLRRRLAEYFSFILSFALLIGGFTLFMQHYLNYDVKHAGYIFAFSGLIGAIVQGGILGRLAKHYGEFKLSRVGFATMAIAYGLLGAVGGLPFLLVLVAIGSFGSAVTRPALTTLLTESVGRHEQGAALGVSQSLGSIAQALGPLISGWLIEHRLFTAYGITAGGVALVGLILRLLPEPNMPMAPYEPPAPVSE